LEVITATHPNPNPNVHSSLILLILSNYIQLHFLLGTLWVKLMLTIIIFTWLICVSNLNIFRFLWYVFPNNNFSFTVNQNIDQFLNLDKTSVTKEKKKNWLAAKVTNCHRYLVWTVVPSQLIASLNTDQ